jgi:NADH dehydrogenase
VPNAEKLRRHVLVVGGLIGFRNRLVVLVDWAWAYFGYRRGSRLITGHRLQPGSPERRALAEPSAAIGETG